MCPYIDALDPDEGTRKDLGPNIIHLCHETREEVIRGPSPILSEYLFFNRSREAWKSNKMALRKFGYEEVETID